MQRETEARCLEARIGQRQTQLDRRAGRELALSLALGGQVAPVKATARRGQGCASGAVLSSVTTASSAPA
jgi:hypothetical protein